MPMTAASNANTSIIHHNFSPRQKKVRVGLAYGASAGGTGRVIGVVWFGGGGEGRIGATEG